jgi:hypothetical protein
MLYPFWANFRQGQLPKLKVDRHAVLAFIGIPGFQQKHMYCREGTENTQYPVVLYIKEHIKIMKYMVQE